MVSCTCLLSNLDQKLDKFLCPGCSGYHDTVVSSFTKLSPVAEHMINNMLLNCEECCKPVKLQEGCFHHDTGSAIIDSRKHSFGAQPTTAEKQVATNVVTRLLHNSDSALVTLPTGGRVSTIKYLLYNNCFI